MTGYFAPSPVNPLQCHAALPVQQLLGLVGVYMLAYYASITQVLLVINLLPPAAVESPSKSSSAQHRVVKSSTHPQG